MIEVHLDDVGFPDGTLVDGAGLYTIQTRLGGRYLP